MPDDRENRVSEFQTALNRGEEAAEELSWPLPWDAGAPLPHVVASEHKMILVYGVADHDEEWDGTWVRVVDPAAETQERLALVTFERCYAHKFGGPNDEVMHGHPLHGRGLNWYAAHLVHNSMWLMQEEAINSVHEHYNPTNWRKRRHFLLCFHDTTFECLADSYKVEGFEGTFRGAIDEAVGRIVS